MTLITEQTYAASIDGFEVLVESETTSSGKKIVSHEYPNSNKRFSEELGQIPPKFSLNVVVHGSIQDRIRLEEILRQPGLLTLVHPYYGSVEVMSQEFTVSSNQTRIGEFRFSINFETSEANIAPSPSANDANLLSSNRDDAFSAIGGSLEENYKDPESSVNYTDAIEKVTDVLTSIQSGVTLIKNPIGEGVSELNTTINTALSAVGTAVSNGTEVRELLDSVYISINNVVNTPADLEDFWTDLTNFGSTGGIPDVVSSYVNTVKREERVTNESLIGEHTRLMGVIGLFEASGYKNYDTVNRLEAQKETLKNTYNQIVRDDTDLLPTVSLIDDPDTQHGLNTLRNNTIEVLDEKNETVSRITTINTISTPLSVLVYNNYGHIDDIETIQNLNPEQPANNVLGDVSLVTEE